MSRKTKTKKTKKTKKKPHPNLKRYRVAKRKLIDACFGTTKPVRCRIVCE